jgi:hypothetical protein
MGWEPDDLSLEGDLRALRLPFCPCPTGAPVETEVAQSAETTARLLEKRGFRLIFDGRAGHALGE